MVFGDYILMKVNTDVVYYCGTFKSVNRLEDLLEGKEDDQEFCWREAKWRVEYVKEYIQMYGISAIYRMVPGEKYTFKIFVEKDPMGVSTYDLVQDLRVEFPDEFEYVPLVNAAEGGYSGTTSSSSMVLSGAV